jgi:hypothetical protein
VARAPHRAGRQRGDGGAPRGGPAAAEWRHGGALGREVDRGGAATSDGDERGLGID